MRELNLLTPQMQAKANKLIEICKNEFGFDVLIYFTKRSLEEQAKMWRQSRSIKEINDKIEDFKSKGFDFLAEILESVGPQFGAWATDACCGESWHQYGEAIDCVPLVDGKCVWDDFAKFKAIGLACNASGLSWGGNWKRKDMPHCQNIERKGNPLEILPLDQIKSLLETSKPEKKNGRKNS